MRLSIRNRPAGTVQSVTVGPARTNVHSRLTGGQDVTAAITGESTDVALARP